MAMSQHAGRWAGPLMGLLAVILVFGLGIATGRQAGPGPADPLVALNDHFHENYRQARVDRLAKVGPVVVVGFDRLALVRRGARLEVPFPPPLYHKYKEVAHVPLQTYVMLVGLAATGEPFDAVRRAEIGHVRELVAAALDGIDRSGFPAPTVDRQREILGMTLDYLSKVLADGKAETGSIEEFARRAGPLLLANADDASKAHLVRLNAQMEAWRRELTAEEWKTFHVVVMSVHMARDREISMQYFARLLGESTEGHRIIFTEGLTDEAKAMDLLGTHLLDGGAALAFFGEESRLHRDLLSDGATKALRVIPIRQ
jgi:hypothetical protein